jgi:hypothetical protein
MMRRQVVSYAFAEIARVSARFAESGLDIIGAVAIYAIAVKEEPPSGPYAEGGDLISA